MPSDGFVYSVIFMLSLSFCSKTFSFTKDDKIEVTDHSQVAVRVWFLYTPKNKKPDFLPKRLICKKSVNKLVCIMLSLLCIYVWFQGFFLFVCLLFSFMFSKNLKCKFLFCCNQTQVQHLISHCQQKIRATASVHFHSWTVGCLQTSMCFANVESVLLWQQSKSILKYPVYSCVVFVWISSWWLSSLSHHNLCNGKTRNTWL